MADLIDFNSFRKQKLLELDAGVRASKFFGEAGRKMAEEAERLRKIGLNNERIAYWRKEIELAGNNFERITSLERFIRLVEEENKKLKQNQNNNK